MKKFILLALLAISCKTESGTLEKTAGRLQYSEYICTGRSQGCTGVVCDTKYNVEYIQVFGGGIIATGHKCD